MNTHELCCVGHITLDKVVTPKNTVHMPGGTSFYFSHAIKHFDDIDYTLVTDNRTQRVLAKADPFTVEYLENINSKIFHLGSLLADDFSLEVVKYLAGKGLVSIDSQGYLREVRDKDVFAVDWPEKKEVLKYVHFLKANEHEMEVLTGYTDAVNAGKVIYDWGVKEEWDLSFTTVPLSIKSPLTYRKK